MQCLLKYLDLQIILIKQKVMLQWKKVLASVEDGICFCYTVFLVYRLMYCC